MASEKKRARATKGSRSVFIVEDHPIFRQGLAQMINGADGLAVCGEAGNARQALEAIGRLNPDLALVDITLPGKSGLELIKEIRAKGHKVKLLAVSMHDEALYADRVLRAGGDGYIMKQEDPEEILHAVRDVLAGHIYVSEQVFENRSRSLGASSSQKKRKVSSLEMLTDSELEILELLGQGKSDKEMAKQLDLSAEAIKRGCRAIQKKLGFKNANALTCYAATWITNGSH